MRRSRHTTSYTHDILKQIVDAASKVISSHFHVSLCKAMFLLSFHAFLRVGEITVSHASGSSNMLQVQDVSFNWQANKLSGMRLVITNYKHSDKRPFTIDIPISRDKTYCPVVTLHYYLSISRHRHGPLFQFGDGSPITYAFFNDKLRSTLRFIGLNSNQYKSHSLRLAPRAQRVAWECPNSLSDVWGAGNRQVR